MPLNLSAVSTPGCGLLLGSLEHPACCAAGPAAGAAWPGGLPVFSSAVQTDCLWDVPDACSLHDI